MAEEAERAVESEGVEIELAESASSLLCVEKAPTVETAGSATESLDQTINGKRPSRMRARLGFRPFTSIRKAPSGPLLGDTKDEKIACDASAASKGFSDVRRNETFSETATLGTRTSVATAVEELETTSCPLANDHEIEVVASTTKQSKAAGKKFAAEEASKACSLPASHAVELIEASRPTTRGPFKLFRSTSSQSKEAKGSRIAGGSSSDKRAEDPLVEAASQQHSTKKCIASTDSATNPASDGCTTVLSSGEEQILTEQLDIVKHTSKLPPSPKRLPSILSRVSTLRSTAIDPERDILVSTNHVHTEPKPATLSCHEDREQLSNTGLVSMRRPRSEPPVPLQISPCPSSSLETKHSMSLFSRISSLGSRGSLRKASIETSKSKGTVTSPAQSSDQEEVVPDHVIQDMPPQTDSVASTATALHTNIHEVGTLGQLVDSVDNILRKLSTPKVKGSLHESKHFSVSEPKTANSKGRHRRLTSERSESLSRCLAQEDEDDIISIPRSYGDNSLQTRLNGATIKKIQRESSVLGSSSKPNQTTRLLSPLQIPSASTMESMSMAPDSLASKRSVRFSPVASMPKTTRSPRFDHDGDSSPSKQMMHLIRSMSQKAEDKALAAIREKKANVENMEMLAALNLLDGSISEETESCPFETDDSESTAFSFNIANSTSTEGFNGGFSSSRFLQRTSTCGTFQAIEEDVEYPFGDANPDWQFDDSAREASNADASDAVSSFTATSSSYGESSYDDDDDDDDNNSGNGNYVQMSFALGPLKLNYVSSQRRR